MRTHATARPALVLALAAGLFAPAPIAQGALVIGGRRANFGTRTLRSGFLPDPQRVNVVSGGNLDARSMGLGPGCIGWVTREPDFILRLQGGSPNLRFYVTSTADTTLLVNTANGTWRCNDDSYGGTNPTVDLPNATQGQYDVWIGSFQSGVQSRGVLSITELDSHP